MIRGGINPQGAPSHPLMRNLTEGRSTLAWLGERGPWWRSLIEWGIMENSAVCNEYTDRSAEYCRDLFDCAAKFFEANKLVEEGVLVAGERTYVELFLSCARSGREALSGLQVFRRLHESTPGALVIDFDAQESRLSRLSSSCSTIAEKFANEPVTESLQDEIWSDDSYTELFIRAARCVTGSIEWQCRFAERANLES